VGLQICVIKEDEDKYFTVPTCNLFSLTQVKIILFTIKKNNNKNATVCLGYIFLPFSLLSRLAFPPSTVEKDTLRIKV